MNQYWLIEESCLLAAEQALAAGWRPTAAQEAEIEARTEALRTGAQPRALQAQGGVSHITIEGALTKKPDFFSMLFGGGTSYEEITAAFRAADLDPNTTEIEATLSTPGGATDGLFECLAAIQATRKPIRVVASQACSAGYALAAAMGPITASSPAAMFGSIGVMTSFVPGGSRVVMRSTDAPLKNADPSSEEGKAGVQAHLDEMHALFVQAIAQGRGIDAAQVNAGYGKGAVLLAEKALSAGMVDGITRSPLRAANGTKTKAVAVGGAPRSNSMDLTQLKAEHRALYDAIRQEALVDERDRVAAHLTLGEASGDMKTALAAVRDGLGMTASIQATYMAASMSKRDRTEAQADSDAAEQVLAEAVSKPADKDLGDLVAANLALELGGIQ